MAKAISHVMSPKIKKEFLTGLSDRCPNKGNLIVSASEAIDATSRLRMTLRSWSARASRLLLGALKEPLFHFALAGLALFVAGRVYQEQTSVYRILETPAHTAQIANEYVLQYGAQPDAITLEALVRRDLHDEILFRQGLAMNLDRDDEIVRRRVVQKMQFLLQDLHPPNEPTDAQLTTFYNAHKSRYVLPAHVTFSHIYFSSDKGGSTAAQKRAEAILAKLPATTTRAPDLGDPFPDLYDFSNYDAQQAFRLFGHTPFADALFKAPVGKWSGPFRSAYGWHLIFVDSRKSEESPPLSKVRDAVRTDLLQDAQDKANHAAFADLAKQFTIVRQDRKAAP